MKLNTDLSIGIRVSLVKYYAEGYVVLIVIQERERDFRDATKLETKTFFSLEKVPFDCQFIGKLNPSMDR